MTNTQKTYLTVGFILLFVALWSVGLWYWGPDRIVAYIGVQNGYLLAFVAAVLGGVSSFTAFSYLATVATLVSGGLNPWLVGPIAGVGIFLSDSLFFYLGLKGRQIISPTWDEKRERFAQWLKRKPRWVAPLITYIYTGFTPLPNDILMVTLAFAEVPYRRIVLPLLAGSITLTTLAGLLARTGFQFLIG